MHTLEDMLLAEQARCRQLAREYTELGTAAAFARALIEDCLRNAEEALLGKQLIAMQRALERLLRFQTLNHLAIQVSHGARPAPVHRPAMAQRAPVRLQEQFFTWTRAA
ncbi:hypothetical protein [Ideonella sp.]|uniref:hypothetical protein n=1 Tax=Ideonella sp. TaxID=1929293 RepID=UPI002B470AC6|nr:hypothetical protein [Ideonella sp.]HJV68822.1 hypothetical protein [Ideonella sp.]